MSLGLMGACVWAVASTLALTAAPRASGSTLAATLTATSSKQIVLGASLGSDVSQYESTSAGSPWRSNTKAWALLLMARIAVLLINLDSDDDLRVSMM